MQVRIVMIGILFLVMDVLQLVKMKVVEMENVLVEKHVIVVQQIAIVVVGMESAIMVKIVLVAMEIVHALEEILVRVECVFLLL
jgi:hypothetical protein